MWLLACAAPPALEPPGNGEDTVLLDASSATPGGADAEEPEPEGPGDTDTGGVSPEPPPLAGPRGLLVAQSWDHAAYPAGAGAGEYRVILLQESMYALLPEIRAANPGAILLAYQKAGGMRADGGEHPSTGVRVDQAEESWFLHDGAGERLMYCDYEGVWAANVGDPGYQARWLAEVSARVTADGFDGVMLDDTNVFPGHCLGSQGTPIAEYPTDEAYGDAVVAFIAAVGPGLQERGLLVAPNIAMNPWEDTHLAQSAAMVPYITHWVREYWMRWNDSANFVGDEWAATLQTMRVAQEGGAGYLALTYGPGEEGAAAGQRYGRASWLLAWDGGSDSAWGYWGAGEDPWSEGWGPDLGLPVGEAYAVGEGWARAYTRGSVVVNPGESPVTVEIEGEAVEVAPGDAVLRPSASPPRARIRAL